MIYSFFLIVLIVGCQKTGDVQNFLVQEFAGRDEIISYGKSIRRPVYQAKVPIGWNRIDPSSNESLTDTTKPIVTFTLEENVIVTIHTFPTCSINQRIAPTNQVQRWCAQLKEGSYRTEFTGHGGFSGLYFEGKNDTNMMCAWSLSLDFDHYQTLHFLAMTVEEEEHYKQMAADYTIKAIGPIKLVEKHLEEIFLFANSFELIQELPTRM